MGTGTAFKDIIIVEQINNECTQIHPNFIECFFHSSILYVGVVWFIFQVLQPIKFTHNKACDIALANLRRSLNKSRFGNHTYPSLVMT